MHSSEEVLHLLYFSAMTHANIHNDYKWKLTQYLPVNWIQKKTIMASFFLLIKKQVKVYI